MKNQARKVMNMDALASKCSNLVLVVCVVTSVGSIFFR